ncbi:MAG: hypothetical protein AB8G05_22285 [Oligoflexales bacterium]
MINLKFKSSFLLLLTAIFPVQCGDELTELIEQKDQSQELALIDTISGYIQTTFNSGGQFASWKLFLMQKSSNKGYLSQINALGEFDFSNVEANKTYTLYLFNPDYQIASALSLKGSLKGSVGRYFEPKNGRLPYLISKGQTMTFNEPNELTIDDSYLLEDNDENSIPDAVGPFWALTDEASIAFLESEFDRDGDGISNIFDNDDDNDLIVDLIDEDSNEDGIKDLSAASHDHYYPSDIEMFNSSIERHEQADGSFLHYLSIRAKFTRDFVVKDLKVLGPESVLTGSVGINTNPDGSIGEFSWDGSLFDDGTHFDMATNDRVYATKIRLTSSLPRRFHCIFIEIISEYSDLDKKGETVAKEHKSYYGRGIHTTELGNISASIDANNLVSISGDPFPLAQSFEWTLLIYDGNGSTIYESQTLPSSTVNLQLPTQALPTANNLSYKVVASTIQRTSGYPEYSVHSLANTLDLSASE